jgi:hypothetical protein
MFTSIFNRSKFFNKKLYDYSLYLTNESMKKKYEIYNKNISYIVKRQSVKSDFFLYPDDNPLLAVILCLSISTIFMYFYNHNGKYVFLQ